jgi:hypothetical protein
MSEDEKKEKEEKPRQKRWLLPGEKPDESFFKQRVSKSDPPSESRLEGNPPRMDLAG